MAETSVFGLEDDILRVYAIKHSRVKQIDSNQLNARIPVFDKEHAVMKWSPVPPGVEKSLFEDLHIRPTHTKKLALIYTDTFRWVCPTHFVCDNRITKKEIDKLRHHIELRAIHQTMKLINMFAETILNATSEIFWQAQPSMQGDLDREKSSFKLLFREAKSAVRHFSGYLPADYRNLWPNIHFHGLKLEVGLDDEAARQRTIDIFSLPANQQRLRRLYDRVLDIEDRFEHDVAIKRSYDWKEHASLDCGESDIAQRVASPTSTFDGPNLSVYADPKEACVILGVSDRTVRTWCRDGKPPCHEAIFWNGGWAIPRKHLPNADA